MAVRRFRRRDPLPDGPATGSGTVTEGQLLRRLDREVVAQTGWCEGNAVSEINDGVERAEGRRVRTSTALLRRAVPLARPTRPWVPVRGCVGFGRRVPVRRPNGRDRNGVFSTRTRSLSAACGNTANQAVCVDCSTWNGAAREVTAGCRGGKQGCDGTSGLGGRVRLHRRRDVGMSGRLTRGK